MVHYTITLKKKYRFVKYALMLYYRKKYFQKIFNRQVTLNLIKTEYEDFNNLGNKVLFSSNITIELVLQQSFMIDIDNFNILT